MLIAGALVFNFVITSENIPKTLSAMLKTYELSPLVFLLLVNILLLILGCFLEGTTIILVILPVLLPTVTALGIDPVHFGVMAVVNIMLGLVTPPYGLLLFMMTKIADVPLRDIVRESMPYLYVMFGALALITLVPDTVLFLPQADGLQGLTRLLRGKPVATASGADRPGAALAARPVRPAPGNVSGAPVASHSRYWRRDPVGTGFCAAAIDRNRNAKWGGLPAGAARRRMAR